MVGKSSGSNNLVGVPLDAILKVLGFKSADNLFVITLKCQTTSKCIKLKALKPLLTIFSLSANSKASPK